MSDQNPIEGQPKSERPMAMRILRGVAWTALAVLLLLVILLGGAAYYTTTSDFQRRVNSAGRHCAGRRDRRKG